MGTCILFSLSGLGQNAPAVPSQNSADDLARNVAPSDASFPDAPGMQAETPSSATPVPTGSIAGLVVDGIGNVIPAAHMTLVRDGSGEQQQGVQEGVTDSNGRFSFSGVAAGGFQITVTAPGFATGSMAAILHPGESLQMPDMVMTIGAITTEVVVTMTQQELAEQQIKVEEKQRVLGAIPNFYVSYDHNAVPLTSKQKFELAWKSSIDPFAFIGTGIGAGVEQATDAFSGYGQGAQGYAKRYGAGYGDLFIGTMIGGAVLPSLLKQDPRYFWKGEGTVASRVRYALDRAVLTRGDNGQTQVDYSGILGDLAAAGISNLYYPASDRNGAGLFFENFAIGIGGAAVGNLFQEFLVRKLTPHTRVAKAVDP